jgi:hypothetical protein
MNHCSAVQQGGHLYHKVGATLGLPKAYRLKKSISEFAKENEYILLGNFYKNQTYYGKSCVVYIRITLVYTKFTLGLQKPDPELFLGKTSSSM